MRAIKQGLIYQNKGWAQCPVVDDLGDKLRVYYANRDNEGHAYITYVELDAADPKKILYRHVSPIVSPGVVGAFDEHGMIPSCVKIIGNQKFLYYTGWSRKSSVPYENHVGIIKVSGNFHQRLYRGPIIGSDQYDPFITGSLTVTNSFQSDPGLCFKGYYLSGDGWKDGEPFYHIKSATSIDGINWEKSRVVEIALNKGEGGICSPAPFGNNMLFCVRGDFNYRELYNKTYRIEWASHGVNRLVREGKLEWEGENLNWDSLMQCYPYVHKNLLFYNGNFFGRTGFGFAILQE